jgi:hypothetical protein
MAKPTLKVELQIDETADLLPFFTLDDPVAGVLDNTDYPLGGLQFVDVTQYVAGVTTRRGISRELERSVAGQARISLSNDTRLFDPENPDSNFSTQLLPRRELRVTANGTAVYLGVVDDWNFQYDLTGNNLSIAECSDKFTFLAQQLIDETVVPVEFPGPRMERILDLPEIDWSPAERNIDNGHIQLIAGTVSADTNALEYLRYVAQSEDGEFFIAKDGRLRLRDGLTGPSTLNLVTLSSEGDGVPFTEIEVVYGSELLYNRIELTTIEGFVITADSTSSQALYGIATLSRSNFLGNLSDAIDLVTALLNRYDEPEYRFERIMVDITELTSLQQTALLNAEINDVFNIRFRPNNIGPLIEKYAEVIGIGNLVDTKRHKMEFRFRTLDYAPFVLDDSIFGTLGGTNDKYLGGTDDIYNKTTYDYDETGIPFEGVIPNSGIFYDNNDIQYDGRLEEGNRLG